MVAGKEVAQGFINRLRKMESCRSTYDTVYQDISELVTPNRQDFTVERTSGERRDRRVFDTTAVQANETLASIIHSGLTSPISKWFLLRIRDPELQDNEEVKRWLSRTEDKMFEIFSRSEHGFSQQNHELLMDLVAYGTAAMLVEDDPDLGIIFHVRHLSEIYVDENSKGVVDTVFRKFKFTARQAIQEWPDLMEMSPEIKKAIMSEPDKKFEFVHAVIPKKDYERVNKNSKIADRFEYASINIMVDSSIVVSEKGFIEMPYLVPRWAKLVGEVYGRSPAWNALADIRMINSMSEAMIRAAQKEVDPPLLMADEGVLMPLQTFPSGVNIGGVDENGNLRVRPMVSGTRLDIGLEMMEQRREAVRQAYFVDLFTREGVQPLTATETIDRKETRLALTAPQTRRLEDEYLTKLINRVYGIMERRGLLPPAPAILDGVDIDVEYISPLANTQKSQQLLSYQRWFNLLAPVAQANPEVLDVLDADDMARVAAEFSGVPYSSIKTKDQVEDIREQRQQQRSQQQQAEIIAQAADSAAKLQKSGIPVVE